jgi:hypothetical protein
MQGDQKGNKAEHVLQIIGHVVAEIYAKKHSMHGRREFVEKTLPFRYLRLEDLQQLRV